MLGAYLIRHPIVSFPRSSPAGHEPVLHNGVPTVTSVFYVAAMCSFVNLLLVLFVFPESLAKKKANAAGKSVGRMVPVLVPATQAGTADPAGGTAASPAWLLHVFTPLALLAPKKIPRPEGGYRRDWSLTVLGVGLFMFLLATVGSAVLHVSIGQLTDLVVSGHIPDQVPLRWTRLPVGCRAGDCLFASILQQR